MLGFLDLRRAERREAFARPAYYLLGGFLPALMTTLTVIVLLREGAALDFHYEFRPAGVQVLHGLDPYAPRFQHLGIEAGDYAFPYTPFTALVFTPMALLPIGAADAVFTLVTLAALLATLWLLDIRDVRIYGIVLVWAPTVSLYQVANLTSLLTLAVAIMWRWRDSARLQGVLLAVAVSLKVFFWPIGLWLLFTRRFRAAAWAVATAVVLNVVSFAVVGFDRLDGYRRLTKEITQIMESRGYSVASVVLHAGGDRTVAYALTAGFSAACIAGCFVAARRGREREALTLAIATSLVASPVVWTHYFVLLVVPMALAAPAWRRVWLLPMLFWACPPVKPHDPSRYIGAVVLTVVFIKIVSILRADDTDGGMVTRSVPDADTGRQPRLPVATSV